jgi:tripartite-type tricarboxylate transporter receptor subunit TctC
VRSIAGGIVVAALVLLAGFSPAWGEDYPNRAIKVIVPYPAGGAGDIVMRVVGQRLGELWSQAIVVDDRTGGSGIIGTEAAARSAPDGYTLLLTAPDTLTILPSLFAKLPYDWKRDFVPISVVASMNMVLVVNPSLPAHNIKELIALAKEKPGQLTYASTGVGSYPHLNAEMFKSLAGVDILNVPYKGGQQGMTAVLAGEVSMFFLGESTAAPAIEAGQLRALGTTARRHSTLLANVPPIADSGLPDFDLDVWFGLFAPAGTPDAIVKKINADWAKAVQSKDFRDSISTHGFDAVSDTPDEFRTLIEKGQDRFAALIKTIGVKPQ